MGSVKKYIAYADHCEVVSECRRLLELLKLKYEDELGRLSASLSRSKRRVEDLESENEILKNQLRETRILLSDSKKVSRKRACLIAEYQRKNADLNRELQQTVSSLENLILFSKSLADDNLLLKKICTDHSKGIQQWTNRTRQEHRRLRLLQLHRQDTEKTQAVFKCHTRLLDERYQWARKKTEMEERLAKVKKQNRYLREQLYGLETVDRTPRRRRL